MKQTIISLLLAAIFLASFVYAAGLGVAPATLKYENALKGATTEKEIVVQNPGDEAIKASIEIEGDISDWIDISPASTVDVPAKGQTKVTLKLTPPANEENGEYKAKIHVRAQGSADIEGSGMGLLPGVDTDLVATITDKEIIAGEVEKILTKDEEYGTPVKFTIGFINKGNIPLGPNVRIEIIKRGTGTIDTIEETMEKIQPGASKDYIIEWDTTGKEQNVYYRATVTVSLNGEVIETKEEVGFRILEKGYFTAETEEESSPLVGIVIVAIFVIIAAILYYVVLKKPKK